MEGDALEGVDSRKLGDLRVREDSQRCDEVGCREMETLVRGDIPLVASSIVLRRGDRVLKDVIPCDTGLVRGIDDLSLEVFCVQVPCLPQGRVSLVGEAIYPALGVRMGTGVLVPVPGTAESTVFFDPDDVLEMQLVLEQADETCAAEPSPGDDSVDLVYFDGHFAISAVWIV